MIHDTKKQCLKQVHFNDDTVIFFLPIPLSLLDVYSTYLPSAKEFRMP